jgi:hypothetical protein
LRTLRTAALPAVPIPPTAGTKPLAILVAERPHGKGEQEVLLDDSVQQDILSVVCAAFQIIRGELDLFRLSAVFSSWAQQLTQSCLYLVRKALQATAAFESQGRADLTPDEHIPSPPLDKEMPTGLYLDREALQALPPAVLASNIEAQTLLRNVRILQLHGLQDPIHT